MKIVNTWQDNMKFESTNETGYSVTMDTKKEVGGEESAPTPKEMVLSGLAGCTGMDVIAILRKMRVMPDQLRIEVEAEQTETHPKVFSKIHLKYFVSGNVPVEKLERAIKMSQEMYCGVSEMLRKTAEITYEYIYQE